MINFTIPGCPRTKKNSMQIVNRRLIPSKAFTDYQNSAGWYIPHKGDKIDKPVNIKCVYYMDTRRKVDLLNLLSATMDILVHYGVILDDNSGIVVSHDGSQVMYDKAKPRVEIEITEVKK